MSDISANLSRVTVPTPEDFEIEVIDCYGISVESEVISVQELPSGQVEVCTRATCLMGGPNNDTRDFTAQVEPAQVAAFIPRFRRTNARLLVRDVLGMRPEASIALDVENERGETCTSLMGFSLLATFNLASKETLLDAEILASIGLTRTDASPSHEVTLCFPERRLRTQVRAVRPDDLRSPCVIGSDVVLTLLESDSNYLSGLVKTKAEFVLDTIEEAKSETIAVIAGNDGVEKAIEVSTLLREAGYKVHTHFVSTSLLPSKQQILLLGCMSRVVVHVGKPDGEDLQACREAGFPTIVVGTQTQEETSETNVVYISPARLTADALQSALDKAEGQALDADADGGPVLSETDAVAAVIRALNEDVDEIWASFAALLDSVFPGKHVVMAERGKRELWAALAALDAQALPNLFPATEAARFDALTRKSVVKAAALPEFLLYEEAFKNGCEQIETGLRPDLELSRLLLARVCAEKGNKKFDFFACAQVAVFLSSYAGRWKRLQTAFKIAGSEKASS